MSVKQRIVVGYLMFVGTSSLIVQIIEWRTR